MKGMGGSGSAVQQLFGLVFSGQWIRDWQKAHRSQPAQSARGARRAQGRARGQPERVRGFYERIFSLRVTLWYLLFQRLHADGTLAAVVRDVRAGGADRLDSRPGKLSQRVVSHQTSAYNQARQRLPEELLRVGLAHLGQRLLKLVGRVAQPKRRPRADRRSWQVLDGSTLAMLWTRCLGRVYGAQHGRGPSDWCLMRVVVGFCLCSGAVLSAAEGAVGCSEQALAWRLMEQAAAFTIWMGDRNFGVWSVVAQALLYKQDVLVRLTWARARKLAGPGSWSSGQRRAVCWQPSRQDQAAPGTIGQEVRGYLIYARVRRGPKWIDLWLFTTLDAGEFSVEQLVQQYGLRWRVELHFRSVKTQMRMSQLAVSTPEMARKEFYAGLLAFSLVRAVMYGAGSSLESGVETISFSQARRVLVDWLRDWGRGLGQGRRSVIQWTESLLAEVGSETLPKRKKKRRSEVRRVRKRASKFPPLKGSRAAARKRYLHAKSL